MKKLISQDICRRCLEENDKKWTEREETNWLRGNVNCPSKIARSYPNVTCVYEEPPKWCKYTLEHIVFREKLK